ncbi:hypothetical protein [Streptomyces diastatochromogenes]
MGDGAFQAFAVLLAAVIVRLMAVVASFEVGSIAAKLLILRASDDSS